MRWALGEAAANEAHQPAARLAASLGLLPAVGRALWARGLRDTAAAERFLSPRLDQLPDPFGLKGIDAAVARMQRALEEREPLCVYGDYDVDGVTSTALLVSTLRQLAACAPGPALPARVEFYVPHRLVEGYGLNLEAMRKLSGRGTRLLVSADCGVTAVEEVEAANKLGMDVVVIDHHTAAQSLPRAVAILNPHQPGCVFPGRELAAVGVAFHLLLALRKTLRDAGWFANSKEPNLREQLDLVALGTIADVVPLTGPNRVLVHFGLKELARAARPGILALKAVAQVAGEVSCSDVGFKLGPRINAAGRLDDASVGVRLLLTEDLAEARALAEQLDRANGERQELQARIAGEALAQAEKVFSGSGPAAANGAQASVGRSSIVVSSRGWHVGVVGIVASRIVERFHRPTLVLADDGAVAKGSGRSIEGFHLYDALAQCASHLTRFGGHRHAAGVTLPSDGVQAFAEALEARARAWLDPEKLSPRLRVDAEIDEAEIHLELARQLQRLAPFGVGNPEPVFICRTLTAHEIRVLPDKRGAGPGHLKLRLGPEPSLRAAERSTVLDAIGFGLGAAKLARGERFDGAFQLGLDSYFGTERLQLKMKDLRT
jgi:single-stranded-DNA-specific exonuclease